MKQDHDRRTTPPAGPALAASLALALAALLPGAPAAAAQPAAAEAAAATARTVLITGANRGLGYEFARQYAADGWRVIGTARKPAEAKELAELGVRVMALDVADPTSVERLAAELADEGFTCVVVSPGWVQADMGGPNAALTPEQSIRGMRKVISGLTPGDTGTYWNHDGEKLPW